MVDEEGKDSGKVDEPVTHTNLDLSGKNLPQNQCDFKGHIFEDKATFIRTTFAGLANFEGATFKNGVDFSNARFLAGASFWEAKFINKGVVSFSYAKFENKGQVSFDSARFANEGYVSFESASFKNEGNVFFHRVKFENKGHVSFDFTSFDNEGVVAFDFARFENQEGVHFDAIRFQNKGGVSFCRAEFENEGDVKFEKVIWANKGKLDFSKIKYRNDINIQFHECLFLCERKVDFSTSYFPEKGTLVFQRCHFDLKKYDVWGYFELPEISFNKSWFHNTMFEGGSIEWISDFLTGIEVREDHGDLGRSDDEKKIEKIIKDHKVPFNTSVFMGDEVVLFKDLTTESAKHLTFRLTDLSRAKFDGMTLSHIQLNAPTWWQEKGWWEKNGRSMLYEEYEMRMESAEKTINGRISEYFSNPSGEKDMQMKNLENQYTQLKTNLDKQGDYYNAGYFHYGEQEMRRLRIGWWGRNIILLNLYRACSGYGERAPRAFVYVLIVIFLFSGMLLLVDFKDVLQVWNPSELLTTCTKIVVELITPFSWRGKIGDITGSNLWHYAFLILGQILLYIQIPLLIMAVRRRFKR